MTEPDDLINKAKYELLEIKLKKEGNKDPNRKDIERLIGIGYGQAGLYLNVWRKENVKGKH